MARWPGNAGQFSRWGLHTGTAPRSGARGRNANREEARDGWERRPLVGTARHRRAKSRLADRNQAPGRLGTPTSGRHRPPQAGEIASRRPRSSGRGTAWKGGCAGDLVAVGKCRPGEIGMRDGWGFRRLVGGGAISPGVGKRGAASAVVRHRGGEERVSHTFHRLTLKLLFWLEELFRRRACLGRAWGRLPFLSMAQATARSRSPTVRRARPWEKPRARRAR